MICRAAFVFFAVSGCMAQFSNEFQPNRSFPPRVLVEAGPPARITPDRFTPMPYSFQYVVASPEGSHGRSERADASGRVTGSYTIQLADGRSRTVDYVADERGYRATVKTNEFGTESQNPADVTLTSSAISGKDAALLGERDPNFKRFGPSRHQA